MTQVSVPTELPDDTRMCFQCSDNPAANQLCSKCEQEFIARAHAKEPQP